MRRLAERSPALFQSRIQSAIESVANVVVGYAVAIVSQIAVFPWFGIDIPLSSNLAIGAWFTVISLVRSYVLRRWFNGLRFRGGRCQAEGWCGMTPAQFEEAKRLHAAGRKI